MEASMFHQVMLVLESFLALITLVRPLIYQKVKNSLVYYKEIRKQLPYQNVRICGGRENSAW